jgi:hypothetical protein
MTLWVMNDVFGLIRQCLLFSRLRPQQRLAGRSLRANNCLTHRNKDSLPFRRRAAVKSVTDLPIGS